MCIKKCGAAAVYKWSLSFHVLDYDTSQRSWHCQNSSTLHNSSILKIIGDISNPIKNHLPLSIFLVPFQLSYSPKQLSTNSECITELFFFSAAQFVLVSIGLASASYLYYVKRRCMILFRNSKHVKLNWKRLGWFCCAQAAPKSA